VELQEVGVVPEQPALDGLQTRQVLLVLHTGVAAPQS
jgi:hypothetical protein